jgi:hypothetical protein
VGVVRVDVGVVDVGVVDFGVVEVGVVVKCRCVEGLAGEAAGGGECGDVVGEGWLGGGSVPAGVIGWFGCAGGSGSAFAAEAEDGGGGASALHAVEEAELVGGWACVLGDVLENVVGLGACFGGAGFVWLVGDGGDGGEVRVEVGLLVGLFEYAEFNEFLVGCF